MKWFKVLIITVLVLSYIPIIYLCYEDSKVCDELVILQDKSQIEATTIHSYDNGMSDIKLCSGEKIKIPTITIKMVKHIEEND